jgi:ParB-like chromosome segregation protein Spo0J
MAAPKTNRRTLLEIPLDEIYTLPKIKAFRVGGIKEDSEYFDQLMAAMSPLGRLGEGPEDPPPIVVFDRTKRGWPLGDGAHRLAVARKLGWTKIQATVVEGLGEEEQLLFAIAANVRHGLRYDSADWRVVVGTVISIHPEWSDRRVAQESGTSHPTVAKVRAEIEASGVVTGKHLPVTTPRVGRDQKPRLTRGAATTKATTVLEQDPTASIRQVAKQAGVSTRTAQQAKRRLARSGDETGSDDAPAPTDEANAEEEPTDAQGPEEGEPERLMRKPTEPTHYNSFRLMLKDWPKAIDEMTLQLDNVRGVTVPPMYLGDLRELFDPLRDLMDTLFSEGA